MRRSKGRGRPARRPGPPPPPGNSTAMLRELLPSALADRARAPAAAAPGPALRLWETGSIRAGPASVTDGANCSHEPGEELGPGASRRPQGRQSAWAGPPCPLGLFHASGAGPLLPGRPWPAPHAYQVYTTPALQQLPSPALPSSPGPVLRALLQWTTGLSHGQAHRRFQAAAAVPASPPMPPRFLNPGFLRPRLSSPSSPWEPAREGPLPQGRPPRHRP